MIHPKSQFNLQRSDNFKQFSSNICLKCFTIYCSRSVQKEMLQNTLYVTSSARFNNCIQDDNKIISIVSQLDPLNLQRLYSFKQSSSKICIKRFIAHGVFERKCSRANLAFIQFKASTTGPAIEND